MISDKYLMTFANCIPVKGAAKSVLCDLQRNDIFEISNELFEILNNGKGKTIAEIKADFENKLDAEIDQWITLLLENEVIFFTEQPELFPEMQMTWDVPYLINNILIDIKYFKKNKLERYIESVKEIRCHTVQIRFFTEISMVDLLYVLDLLGSTEVVSYEIILPEIVSANFDENRKSIAAYKCLSFLNFYNALEEKYIHLRKDNFCHVVYSTEEILSEKNCGVIAKEYFISNPLTFTESLQYNTCLNRKISIDDEGNIKNCPSMRKTFGNLNDTSLVKAVEKPGFKEYWNINKDKIHVCKDCEFRYICTDCRAYVENPEDIYSKPLKCGYNPYLGEWSQWITNPLKEKAIKYYEMEDLVSKKYA